MGDMKCLGGVFPSMSVGEIFEFRSSLIVGIPKFWRHI